MIEDLPPMLCAVDAAFGFPQRRSFLQSVTMEVRRGECWGIIGPNGAGKSTLLRLLAGLLSPHGGRILLEGGDLRALPDRLRAQRLAFMPQHLPKDLPITGREIVLMGRFPHRQLGLFESVADFEIVDRVMRTTHTTQFADRVLSTLSGGEAQRIHLAAALAQQPTVLLLDEPTAALDLHHQLDIFMLLRRLAQEESMAVVVVTHDLNLAARFCTHVLLLDDGRCVASGPPGEVMQPDRLEAVYHVQLAEARFEGDAGGGDAGRWFAPLRPTGGDR